MGLDFIAATDLRLAIRSGGAIGVRARIAGQTPEAPLLRSLPHDGFEPPSRHTL